MKMFLLGLAIGIVVTCVSMSAWSFYKDLRAWSRPHVWESKDLTGKSRFCEIPVQAFDIYCFRIGFQDETEFVVFRADVKTCWEAAAAHIHQDKSSFQSGTSSMEKMYLQGPAAYGSAYAVSPWNIDDRLSLKMAAGDHRFAAVDESTATVYLCGWNQ